MRAAHYVFGIMMFLFGVAAFSRLISMPGISKYIDNGASALASLFQGAFGK